LFVLGKDALKVKITYTKERGKKPCCVIFAACWGKCKYNCVTSDSTIRIVPVACTE
jgi:hypothetical protein